MRKPNWLSWITLCVGTFVIGVHSRMLYFRTSKQPWLSVGLIGYWILFGTFWVFWPFWRRCWFRLRRRCDHRWELVPPPAGFPLHPVVVRGDQDSEAGYSMPACLMRMCSACGATQVAQVAGNNRPGRWADVISYTDQDRFCQDTGTAVPGGTPVVERLR